MTTCKFVCKLSTNDILDFLDSIRYISDSTEVKISECIGRETFSIEAYVADFTSFDKKYELEYTDTTAKLTSKKSFVIPGKKTVQPIGERTIAIKWVNFLKQKFGDEYIEFFNKSFFVSADGRIVEIDPFDYIDRLSVYDIRDIYVITRKMSTSDWIEEIEEVQSDDCHKRHLIFHYKPEYNMSDVHYVISNFLVEEPAVAPFNGLYLKTMAKKFGEDYLRDFRIYRKNMFYARTIKTVFEQYNEKTESAISKMKDYMDNNAN